MINAFQLHKAAFPRVLAIRSGDRLCMSKIWYFSQS